MNDFLMGLRDNLNGIDFADVTYELFFGINSTFQCIKIKKTNVIEDKCDILLCDGIVHIDEDNLEIIPVYFGEYVHVDVLGSSSQPRPHRIIQIIQHMFSFSMIYIKRGFPHHETFESDPFINFLIRICDNKPLISLDNFILVKDEVSRSLALSFRQLRTVNTSSTRHSKPIDLKFTDRPNAHFRPHPHRKIEQNKNNNINTDGVPESPPQTAACCMF